MTAKVPQLPPEGVTRENRPPAPSAPPPKKCSCGVRTYGKCSREVEGGKMCLLTVCLGNYP